jgi:hypothetical protein
MVPPVAGIEVATEPIWYTLSKGSASCGSNGAYWADWKATTAVAVFTTHHDFKLSILANGFVI